MSVEPRSNRVPRASRACTLVLTACAIALTVPTSARADVHGIESLFGAANIQATLGNGHVAAAVSPDGDITVLSWPSPTHYDHVHYLSQNGPDAREQPLMGAKEGMGIYGGLVYETSDAPGTFQVTWFHHAPWTREVRFTDDDTSVVVGTFTHSALGLTVRQYDMVPSDLDALVRHVEVERDAASTVTDAWLVGYANLAPHVSRIPELPVLDFIWDRGHDYLAIWDAPNESIVQFHPNDTGVIKTVGGVFSETTARDFGPVGELMKSATLDETALAGFVADLDASYAPGVYITMGSDPAPDQFQVGGATTETCAAIDDWADTAAVQVEMGNFVLPEDVVDALDAIRCNGEDPLQSVVDREMWQHVPQDAFEDASDGELSGSPLAGAQANTALRVPLTFEAGTDIAAATLHFAFGETHADARQRLESARALDPDTLRADIEAADRTWVAGLDLPDGATPEVERFSKRVFLNIRAGTHRETGAIVASVSRQPSYHLDWPRDGAFFNVALDLAGQHDLVTQRMDYYSSVMRTRDEDPTFFIDNPVPGHPNCSRCDEYPANSWEMNYYSDGVIGGNTRLEIDNSALVVWAYTYHAGHLEGAARAEYIERVWPTVLAATDFLAGWRDPENGLIWPANEDDNFEFTQGLQGAVTVFAALRASSMMAREVGDEAAVERWTLRAGELRDAALQHLYVDGEGFYNHLHHVDAGQRSRGGATDWMAWPAWMLPADDQRLRDQLTFSLPFKVDAARGLGDGAAYITKNTISIAHVFDAGTPEHDDATFVTNALADEIADPLTHHLGEVFVNVDDDGDGMADRRLNAVAPPHLWAGVLVYLSAMAVHEPDAFDRYLTELPAVEIPEVTAPLDEWPPGSEMMADGDVADGDDTGDGTDASDAVGGSDVGVDVDIPDEEPSSCGCTTLRAHTRDTPGAPLGWLLLVGALVAGVRRRQR